MPDARLVPIHPTGAGIARDIRHDFLHLERDLFRHHSGRRMMGNIVRLRRGFGHRLRCGRNGRSQGVRPTQLTLGLGNFGSAWCRNGVGRETPDFARPPDGTVAAHLTTRCAAIPRDGCESAQSSLQEFVHDAAISMLGTGYRQYAQRLIDNRSTPNSAAITHVSHSPICLCLAGLRPSAGPATRGT